MTKREVKMAGYWPRFFCVFIDRDEVNKGFIIWDKTPKHDKFSLRDKARIPSGQGSSSLSAALLILLLDVFQCWFEASFWQQQAE